jgi:hypothetical protein
MGTKKNHPKDYSLGMIDLTGADNGVRTRDPQLGKLMLYQLSYVRNR